MRYHIDDTAIGLEYIPRRLHGTDPIPSQLPLLENIEETLSALERAGVMTLADLRNALKRPAGLSSLAAQSGVKSEYLILLRRAVEGWFPKPPRLSEFPGIDPDICRILADAGYTDARGFWETAQSPADLAALAARTGIPAPAACELHALCGLTRIQWVSCGFARLLYDAEYRSTEEIAAADGGAVFDAVRELNADKSYYRGAIGKRDMDRLVLLAKMMMEPIG